MAQREVRPGPGVPGLRTALAQVEDAHEEITQSFAVGGRHALLACRSAIRPFHGNIRCLKKPPKRQPCCRKWPN
ncbi:hypothetical protein ACCAA_50043 [Candidatus Accumulibacter aalborgensis]|uniref:Uncharacterized protein n=1 Tax=Candidatus Accumulibacter aalborgensis TaxID=1860102 RepID=A0A1A8XTE1_9PROT|nr:hypothetical protein ACCAA_50043 [Candidatus Accumulibacter aalborgensis]